MIRSHRPLPLMFGMLALLALPSACARPEIPAPEVRVHPTLAAHSAAHDEAKLVRLSEHVYAAIGYDIGNIGFVVTDEGILVFDTGGEVERARRALAALREVSEAPIVGVVYSHGHGDHTGGVDAFVPEEARGRIPIYAGRGYERYLRESAVPRGLMRAYYQMGYLLPKDETGSVGSGIGPPVGTGRTTYQSPTRIVEDTLDLEIGDVRVQLFYSPSDLDDGVSAWIPDDGVMMVGDAAYPMMPAIATPRFEHGRQSWEALESLDRYRQYPIEHLLPGHLHPISGREEVASFLTNFRDLVQYLQDQSIRAVNQRLGHEEAARRIEAQLPPHLAADPDLGEHYHELSWIAKGMYTKAGGWWGGDVVDLVRTTPRERATRLLDLIGSRAKVRRAVQTAFARGERGWAAELARMLIETDPEDADARQMLARILRTIAYDSNTANQRHYLLTEALVMEGRIDLDTLPIDLANPRFLEANPDSVLFRAQGTRLDPVSSADVELTGGFTIRDTGEAHTLRIRRGVIEWQAGRPQTADLRVDLDRSTWIRIAGGHLRWLDAFDEGLLGVRPGRGALLDFVRHFDGEGEGQARAHGRGQGAEAAPGAGSDARD
ncbi:MAG TPA: alkyl sulfatase dimerization domain-containing protein [Myxococcota bacterium]|nr:alkyl sulfatase dimerization domain-containing protein [Myxococcota bacterium]